jgi:predicted small lipoprotein YifL
VTRIVLILFLVAMLGGCGAKRDLVLPDDAPPPLPASNETGAETNSG